jgi:hypothetical protein
VLDANSQEILTDVMKRESASLLCYTADAFPWAAANSAPALEGLREVVSSQKSAVDNLGRYLVKQKVTTPPLGAYPSYYTYLNFLSLKHLLPKLIASEQTLVRHLEADLPRLSKGGAAPVQTLLSVKKAGLGRLEQLQAGLTA